MFRGEWLLPSKAQGVYVGYCSGCCSGAMGGVAGVTWSVETKVR